MADQVVYKLVYDAMPHSKTCRLGPFRPGGGGRGVGSDADNASESHGRRPVCGFMLLILTIMVCSVMFRIISRHRVEAMQQANA